MEQCNKRRSIHKMTSLISLTVMPELSVDQKGTDKMNKKVPMHNKYMPNALCIMYCKYIPNTTYKCYARTSVHRSCCRSHPRSGAHRPGCGIWFPWKGSQWALLHVEVIGQLHAHRMQHARLLDQTFILHCTPCCGLRMSVHLLHSVFGEQL